MLRLGMSVGFKSINAKSVLLKAPEVDNMFETRVLEFELTGELLCKD